MNQEKKKHLVFFNLLGVLIFSAVFTLNLALAENSEQSGSIAGYLGITEYMPLENLNCVGFQPAVILENNPFDTAAEEVALIAPSEFYVEKNEILTQTSGSTAGILASGDWQLVDQLVKQVVIPKDSFYSVYFTPEDGLLKETEIPNELTEKSLLALEIVPTWVVDDLADAFRRLSVNQDVYADLILKCPDPLYIDEIAFTIANVTPEILSNTDFDPELLTINAHFIYENDAFIQYADLKEHIEDEDGNSLPDYYTTIIYRVEENGQVKEFELSRDNYYWYIVHPKVSDEFPLMDERVYGMFWREYLFYYADSDFNFPILKDKISNAQVIWKGVQMDLPAGRPFNVDDCALDVLGNWISRTVPLGAEGNRPIQPNQIAHEHNGNCGELQDIACAGARAALIPMICTSNPCEDHVWDEFFDRQWHPFQIDLGFGATRINNFGIAYDKDVGGSKNCSGIWSWKGNGSIFSVIDHYSKFCKVIIQVLDENGHPVDFSQVRLYTEFYYGGLYPAIWGYADSRGLCEFTVGDSRNYYLQVRDDTFGYYPASGVIQIIQNSQPDAIYFATCNLPGSIETPQVTVIQDPPLPTGDYLIEASFEVSSEYNYGRCIYERGPNDEGGNIAYWMSQKIPGNIDLYVTNAENFALFENQEPFLAALAKFNLISSPLPYISFNLPNQDPWHFIFSNDDVLKVRKRMQVAVNLYHKTPPPYYVIDVFGGRHPSADAEPIPDLPYWEGNPIARDLAFGRDGYYLLDAFGNLYEGGGAEPISSNPVWSEENALDLEFFGSGYYILDKYGWLHACEGSPALLDHPYPASYLDLEFPCQGSGYYLLSSDHGIEAFGGAEELPPPDFTLDWSIIRDFELNCAGQGYYLLDAYGKVYAIDGAPEIVDYPYWDNWQVAIDLELAP